MSDNIEHSLNEAEKEPMAKIDHWDLAKKMDLFSQHDEAPGFPFYKENFIILRNELLNFWREEHRKLGYQEIETPIILKNDLWIKSGHWDYYKDNMYWFENGDEIEVVKPMNCPGGVLVYKEDIHSYRELPLKIAELGQVCRRELSGNIQGLFRTRAFTIDDAHIYLRADQISKAVAEVIDLLEYIYQILGFNYQIALSTRPEKSIGSNENWEKATKSLKQVLDDKKLPYIIKEGEGAFYGPKIDFDIEDSLQRQWQCGTIQLDFNLPERFDLNYQNAEGELEQVILIHRAIFGGIERFIAILLEHFAGKLPLWLAPVQFLLLNIGDQNIDYLKQVAAKLRLHSFRVKVDLRDESLNKRIREGIIQRINYVIIIGDREEQTQTISIRRRDNKKVNNITLDKFLEQVCQERDQKILPKY
ncbi:MAG: threonine--tRNA ligase [Candidatus Heimdallarchaeota archaeon]|nr:threonine--tRNA ligase [Candidatus Heimdallarchaeota archaeon]